MGHRLELGQGAERGKWERNKGDILHLLPFHTAAIFTLPLSNLVPVNFLSLSPCSHHKPLQQTILSDMSAYTIFSCPSSSVCSSCLHPLHGTAVITI